MNLNRTSQVNIQTPEGVTFSLPLAGPVSRFLAWLIDVLVIIGMVAVCCIALGMLAIVDSGFSIALILLAYFAITIGYPIFWEWIWHGQTLGKRALRLRVMDEEGLRLRIGQIVIRNLLRFIDVLPLFYLAGGLVCVLTRNCQRLGDLAAGTIVVRVPRVGAPNLEGVLWDKFNSFRDYPHLEARLRQRVSPQEADLALRAIYRRDRLDAQARVELFAALAEHFRTTVQFPQEATDGLSDEQYVRNVVETLYRPGMSRRKV